MRFVLIERSLCSNPRPRMNQERAAVNHQNTVLIGVDGGASGFRAHEIVHKATAGGSCLALGSHFAEEWVEPVAGFVPQALERQREQARTAQFEFTREERILQARCIHAASRAIARAAARCGGGSLRVGLCAPGVKTVDGRGIAVALNGPRIPDFVAALEQSLSLVGMNLSEAIEGVVSDGLACAHGEELAENGLFAGIRHAYYLGGGSGVAESYKLAGQICAADELSPPVKKAWESIDGDGKSFELHLSASGINRDFGLEHPRPRPGSIFPEDAAQAGDARALGLFRTRATRLAEWCFARLTEIHANHGLVLERIVIGQRLGQFFLDPRLAHCFAQPARQALCVLLEERAPPSLRATWVVNGELVDGRLMGSSLRAAAALGAIALALRGD